MTSNVLQRSGNGEHVGGAIERTMLKRSQASSENEPTGESSSIRVHQEEAEPIVIDGQEDIYSVALLADGKHVVSGGPEGKIRRWRIEDGMEVGTPMVTGSTVLNIAVSPDGKVIVNGTRCGEVTVWNAESHSKVTEFKTHSGWAVAVDVSPDATKLAAGTIDCAVCVWSLSTGERLLGPLEHDYGVVAAKFSPNGHLIATATYDRDSVRVYDSQDGSLLVEFTVKVYSGFNHSLAWASDSLFALSYDGYIHRVDVFTGTTLLKWRIHSSIVPTCIALASNETFIAASAGSSVSFWDTTSQAQIGAVIEYTHGAWSMAISSNYDFVTSGDKRITLRTLCGVLPSHYLEDVSVPA